MTVPSGFQMFGHPGEPQEISSTTPFQVVAIVKGSSWQGVRMAGSVGRSAGSVRGSVALVVMGLMCTALQHALPASGGLDRRAFGGRIQGGPAGGERLAVHDPGPAGLLPEDAHLICGFL